MDAELDSEDRWLQRQLAQLPALVPDPKLRSRLSTAAAPPSPKKADDDEDEKKPSAFWRNPFVRFILAILELLNATLLQFAFYLEYVIVFQLLADATRNPQEFFFDKMIADRFIENHFDSSLNMFD